MKNEEKTVSQSKMEGSLEFPSLQGNQHIKTDVVVVGGGIAGLSVAYTLTRSGRKCVVVEQSKIGMGATGLSHAHLADALDGRYFQLQKIYGTENTKLAAQSHTRAIDAIEEIIKRENIECDFKRLDGYLSLHPSDRIKTLRQEFEASRASGLYTELVSHAPGIKLRERISLKFPGQAQFHTLQYLKGLARSIIKYGGEIYTDTTVLDIDSEGAITTGGRISADHIVLATSKPLNETVRVHVRQLAYRSYVIGATIDKESIPPALWWDTGDHHSVRSNTPYHYARIQPLNEHSDLLVCGGEDHKTETAETNSAEEADRFAYLEAWAYDHFPALKEIVYRWSGQLTEPVDSLGYIGRNPGDSNVYIVSGDAGNGLTYAAIAGILIPDLIMKRKNPWEDLYNPSRTPVQVLGEFLSDSNDMSLQYLDFRMPGDEEPEHTLYNNDGAVIRMHGRRIAVYRDTKGDLHAHLASCPHLGCGLRWSTFEKSFSCPCYGKKSLERRSVPSLKR